MKSKMYVFYVIQLCKFKFHFLSHYFHLKNPCSDRRGQCLLTRKIHKNLDKPLHIPGDALTSILLKTYLCTLICTKRIELTARAIIAFAVKQRCSLVVMHWNYLSTEGWQSGCSSWGSRYVIPTTPTTRRVKGPTCRPPRRRHFKPAWKQDVKLWQSGILECRKNLNKNARPQ